VAAPWRLDADGMLPVPDVPGLGIRLNPDAIAKYGDAPLTEAARTP
jgi:L-alanine-DL-glutamate epimerase-like enolase superfamily enzyme